MHLVGHDFGVIRGQIVASLEAQAKQALCTVEGRGHHGLELEVGLEFGVVQCIARLAHLLGVVAPVPGGNGDAVTPCIGHGLQGIAFGQGLGARRGPDPLEQFGHRGGRARHAVDQRVVGKVRVPVQPRQLGAQLQDRAHHRVVVASRLELTAARPGVERPLAQVAPFAVGEEGHDQRAREGDHPGAGFVPRLGGRTRRVAQRLGQPRQVGLGAQHELPFGLVSQHVLRELRLQRGEFLGDRRHARAGRRREARTGAHEVEVDTLGQAQLLGREAQFEAALVNRVDPRKQRPVQVGRGVVRGQPRRQFALGGLQRGRSRRGGEVTEYPLDALVVGACRVEGGDGVGEVRRRATRGNRIDFGAMRGQRLLEGRCEVLGANRVERRQAMRRVPGCEQRVGGRMVEGHGRWGADAGGARV